MGDGGSLGAFNYVTYSDADFDLFAAEWNNHGGDFAKPGASSANPVSKTWQPTLVSAVGAVAAGPGCKFVLTYSMDTTAHTMFGAPETVDVGVIAPGSNGAAVDIELVWSNKTATRLPESMWLSFVPQPEGVSAMHWSMDVMGFPVDPMDVIERGTRFKHVVQDGVTLGDSKGAFRVRMLDTALVSPGDIHHLLQYSENNTQPHALSGGMHANLYNNLWGTAFPQYYDDDGLARFQVFASP